MSIEQEIINALIQGKSYDEIEATFHVSSKTISRVKKLAELDGMQFKRSRQTKLKLNTTIKSFEEAKDEYPIQFSTDLQLYQSEIENFFDDMLRFTKHSKNYNLKTARKIAVLKATYKRLFL